MCLYLERFGGARPASQMRDTLTERLIECLEKNMDDDWPWFEQVLSYDNAKLPHALIASGRSGGSPRALSLGLQSLTWLVEQQKSPAGCFRPIGSNGFYQRGHERAHFDQQPVEAFATVAACIEAYHATDESAWLKETRLAFEWFLGATTWASTSTTPRPAAVTMVSMKTESTRTREPSQPWPFCCPWAK